MLQCKCEFISGVSLGVEILGRNEIYEEDAKGWIIIADLVIFRIVVEKVLP